MKPKKYGTSLAIIALSMVLPLTACDKTPSSKTASVDDSLQSTQSNEQSLAPAGNVTILEAKNKKIKITKLDQQEVQLGQRVSLLIANANYSHQLPLRYPINNAELLADTLQKQGFIVTTLRNANERNMNKYINEFAKSAKNAESAIFYYSGYGMQDKSRVNYLIPTNAEIKSESDVQTYGVELDSIIDKLEKANPTVSLITLDACHHQQIKESGFQGCLSSLNIEIKHPAMMVSYADIAHNMPCDYDDNSNSPYTFALNELFENMGNEPLLPLLDNLSDKVENSSKCSQRPSKIGNISKTQFLVKKP